MAKQSNIAKIGIERRNEHELLRNDIQKNMPYNEEHDTAVWHEGETDKPLGKGSKHLGHGHSVPQPYNSMTKNFPSNQLDTEQGGGSYDIYGHPEKGGGRNWLMTINLYDKNNQYREGSIDVEDSGETDQFFVK
jgi:hypothetical protein